MGVCASQKEEAYTHQPSEVQSIGSRTEDDVAVDWADPEELRKSTLYREKYWSDWRDELKVSPHHVLFLHGMMGSELFDELNSQVAWPNNSSKQMWNLDNMRIADPSRQFGCRDAEGVELYARGAASVPVIGRMTRAFVDDEVLEPTEYAYDWREDIAVESARLSAFLRFCLEDDDLRSEGIHIVSHSQGGCLVLYMLGQTPDFDEYLNSITFVAPVFGGCLQALQVLEYGNLGTSITEQASGSEDLHSVISSFPSMYQLNIPPRSCFVATFPSAGGKKKVTLQYPIADSKCDLYDLQAFTNPHNKDVRQRLLDTAANYHAKMNKFRKTVAQRLNDKITVLVGINGDTATSAQRGAKNSTQNWILLSGGKARCGKGLYCNGDGVVTLESSFLSGLEPDRHWAYVCKGRSEHASLMEARDVIASVQDIVQSPNHSLDRNHTTLLPYSEFIAKIDWKCQTKGSYPPWQQCLDSTMRAALRTAMQSEKQQRRFGLNPVHDDSKEAESAVYERIEEAVYKVLIGAKELERAATEWRVNDADVEERLVELVAPLLKYKITADFFEADALRQASALTLE